ncbi:hypothetical protein AJ78_08606, partial [Emergomyces pasteurianus Ep9510]
LLCYAQKFIDYKELLQRMQTIEENMLECIKIIKHD